MLILEADYPVIGTHSIFPLPSACMWVIPIPDSNLSQNKYGAIRSLKHCGVKGWQNQAGDTHTQPSLAACYQCQRWRQGWGSWAYFTFLKLSFRGPTWKYWTGQFTACRFFLECDHFTIKQVLVLEYIYISFLSHTSCYPDRKMVNVLKHDWVGLNILLFLMKCVKNPVLEN